MRTAHLAAGLLCVGLALASSPIMAQDPPPTRTDCGAGPDIQSAKPCLGYLEMRRHHEELDREGLVVINTWLDRHSFGFVADANNEIPLRMLRRAQSFFGDIRALFEMEKALDEKLAKEPANEKLRAEVAAERKKLRETEGQLRSHAIEGLKKVARDFPDFPDRDLALLYLSEALWDAGNLKESLSVFKELIAAHPKSPYLPDAYLAFGEYYFDQAEPEKALLAYMKVGEHEDSPVYPYSVYKRGWCHFRLGELDLARKQLALLARAPGPDATRQDPRMATLRRLAGEDVLALGIVDQEAYRKGLEKAWTTLAGEVTKLDPRGQLGEYLAFLADFPRDNPHADRAQEAVERIEAGLAKEAEAKHKAEEESALQELMRMRAAGLEEAYAELEAVKDSASSQFEAWRRFLSDYPVNNPHLEEARQKAGAPPPEAEPSELFPWRLPDAVVYEILARFLPALKGCIEQQVERDPSVVGTMEVTFTINPDGRVRALEVLSREHEGTYAKACFSYVIREIKFPIAREARSVPRLPFKLGCATR
jgi:tetratricopeptide (TPR) repeat protein